ncbi:MAG: NifB/NifX family molybdenum-iron cluster-binding protein [Tepidanaerobacteraceae bacterium]|jgi:predicted Fe-Mo cluster-binding NifX family protein|uniref:NifB/NifX family molybdenum-iron cluster-binding protein n=1 Tax=Tepidanaerobacter sp. GT38 TaxID=2722793 RepID=UPI000AD84883|nr:NifB/NifX family molybdenum-iron cluster-binding protein [Tepidanaerobacter sp. GT38]MCG1011568.1 NifB/NifX family molybdenum-iron cluster-binding protein [Tepidanaerobacter sp. GT38]NLL99185.1 dinitrogenase iron-molybdenum cofactor [Tepidanaerobacter sp.]
MRIAIPTDRGQVSAHFGHCEEFTVYDIDENQKKVIAKEVIENPGHEPGFLPIFLAKQNVNCIIAGGMGSRAKRLFDQNNIQSITGASGIVDEVVQEYLAGQLVSNDNFCDH